MRELKLGVAGEPVRAHASPLTPWIYKREFGTDMLTEVAEMQEAILPDGGLDFSRVNLFTLVQIAWALAATVDPKMPQFSAWLAQLPDGGIDFTEFDVLGVLEETRRGFFRGREKPEADPADDAAEPAPGGEA